MGYGGGSRPAAGGRLHPQSRAEEGEGGNCTLQASWALEIRWELYKGQINGDQLDKGNLIGTSSAASAWKRAFQTCWNSPSKQTTLRTRRKLVKAISFWLLERF